MKPLDLDTRHFSGIIPNSIGVTLEFFLSQSVPQRVLQGKHVFRVL